MAIAAIGVCLSLAGCPRDNAKETGKAPPSKNRSVPDADAGNGAKQSPHAVNSEQPPAPPTIPKVAMSAETAAGCLVGVGDAMPAVELADPAGQKREPASYYGKKLTVLCFWRIGEKPRARLQAEAALQDLMKEVAAPFVDQGVGVAAINVGDPPAEADRFVENAGATFTCLIDAGGKLFEQVAKDRRMPRVYLLDAEGKILWFDVEYSRSSREDLLQGIHAALMN